MKKIKNILIVALLVISPSILAGNALIAENLTDVNWKKGVWILKDGRNGFFITGVLNKVNLTVGSKLKFSRSGERIITDVQEYPPFIQVFVNKPLDPDSDGFPHKIAIVGSK